MLVVYLGAIGGPILEIISYSMEGTPFQAAHACGKSLTIHNSHVCGEEGLKYKLDNIGTVFVQYSHTVKEL
jgi:hypothetical protein